MIRKKCVRILITLSIVLFCGIVQGTAMSDKYHKCDTLHRKKIALVLSGGGAKGMAHIGVLKVLEKAGIPIDIITGTSMGSIVGGLYAIGYDAATLDSLVQAQDWSYLLSDRENKSTASLTERKKQYTYLLTKLVNVANRKGATAGLIKGINLDRLFKRLTSQYQDSISFDNLPIPFACVATNIMNNGEVDIRSGKLDEAMRTSMSIPGAFTPIVKDSMMLVDGGLRNNFPVDLARAMGADIVIGVTLDVDEKGISQIKTGADVLSQIVDINCKNKFDENLADTDIPVRVNCRGYGTMSFSKEAIDSLISRGEEAAMLRWDDLQKLKKELGITDADVKHIEKPTILKEEDIKIKNPFMGILGLNLGARFDLEEKASIQINGTYSFDTPKCPTKIELTTRLGQRFMAQVDASIAPIHFGKCSLSYTFRDNDIYIYNKGKRDHNISYDQHSIDFRPFIFDVRNLQIEMGASWDYFRFTNVLSGKPAEEQAEKIQDLRYFSYRINASFNSEDNPFFTTKGTKFNAEYGYYTDNLIGWEGHRGINIINGCWRTTFPFGYHFALQPMLYGRIVSGKNAPAILTNMVGGDVFGHYLYQQMPFAGISYIEPLKKSFMALRLKSQGRITGNNYVMLDLAIGDSSESIKEIFDRNLMFGIQASYYYNSVIGPVGGSIGWSNHSKKLFINFNIGFYF